MIHIFLGLHYVLPFLVKLVLMTEPQPTRTIPQKLVRTQKRTRREKTSAKCSTAEHSLFTHSESVNTDFVIFSLQI